MTLVMVMVMVVKRQTAKTEILRTFPSAQSARVGSSRRFQQGYPLYGFHVCVSQLEILATG